ncbi:MAG: putative monovalent cation/H+ antiporter subunit A [Cohaesibacter sp.]|jgi:multicomponent Na+:H+ antiporter subunit A|nr:putative monovalent cation/H+ antiporter subunit A [Cohaesibacter sp.]
MTLDFSDGTYLAMMAPFLAALVAPIAKRVLGHNAAWLMALVPAAIFFHLCNYITPVSLGTPVVLTADWLPIYDIKYSLFIDGLSLLFALLISGIGTFIILYAGGYLKGHADQGRFFSFLFLFMGSMLGVVMADNLITLFIYWELTSITSFLLIGFNHKYEASRRAAIQALVVTGGGGLALLAGFILMAHNGGSYEMSELLGRGDILRDNALYVPILLLVLGGAFTKSAQFPFHFWLPNAMEAPTPVSAYLHSATMVKAGVYLLMRVNPILGDTVLWSIILPSFGGVTLLIGTWMALRQRDLKLILAYTTVASLGLLVMLVGTSNPVAITGAVMYLFAHALFKGGLFMIVGTVDHETGTRDLTRLGGLRKLMPISFIAAILSALSMGGLWPMIGFVAKEEVYAGIYGTTPHFIAITAAAVLGNAMMFAAGFIVAFRPFFGHERKTPKKAHEGPALLIAGPIVLSSLGFLAMLFGDFTAKSLLAPMASSVAGQQAHVKIGFGLHVNEALALSGVTVVLGILFYKLTDRIRNAKGYVIEFFGKGPDHAFDFVIASLVRGSTAITRIVQSGNLESYLTFTFLISAAALILPMITFGELPAIPAIPSMHFYEWGVFGLALVGLVAIVIAKTRLTAIVSLGIQGFAVALIFMMFGAPDLSFTQFMVETLSVVIIALVMTRLSLAERDPRPIHQFLMDATVSVSVGVGVALLLIAVTQVPFDSSLSQFFTENSLSIAHGRNIVNVIIVDFRGLDTFGEIAVVMITGLAVAALIRGTKQAYRKNIDPIKEMMDGEGSNK